MASLNGVCRGKSVREDNSTSFLRRKRPRKEGNHEGHEGHEEELFFSFVAFVFFVVQGFYDFCDNPTVMAFYHSDSLKLLREAGHRLFPDIPWNVD